jgi:tetratricopeptide (TPR) repeat protein
MQLNPTLRRPSMMIGAMLLVAVLGFLGVTRLVHRFGEQEKALGRRLYRQGQAEIAAGRPDRAIEAFRAALSYDHENFDYQLSLARALRDTGRVEESKAYLTSLWERTPQNGAVNLALGRLVARQGSIDDAIHYYHNAAYGEWASGAEANRRNAQFELIDFLLTAGAFQQAQSELIMTAATLPHDLALQFWEARMFARAQDYEHALSEYHSILSRDRNSPDALAGAGDAAFHLGRYRTAETFLQEALKAKSQDALVAEQLQISSLIVRSDPFSRHISVAERNRRLQQAFAQAGERLLKCPEATGTDLTASPPSNDDLSSLRAQWLQMKPKVGRLNRPEEKNLFDSAMNLVLQIEQQAEKNCSPASDTDKALLLLAKGRSGVEQ